MEISYDAFYTKHKLNFCHHLTLVHLVIFLLDAAYLLLYHISYSTLHSAGVNAGFLNFHIL